MDIFKNATKAGSFNNWLSNIPEEDLQHLSDLLDEVGAGSDPSDPDTFEQLAALVIHYSGQVELSEEEMSDSLQMLAIMLAMELNVRQGNMTKHGIYSLVKGEDTSTLSMTDKGNEYVKNMIKKATDD